MAPGSAANIFDHEGRLAGLPTSGRRRRGVPCRLPVFRTMGIAALRNIGEIDAASAVSVCIVKVGWALAGAS
jgi:hypothetical protein